MEKQTVTEWLTEKKLTEHEIDFLVTFIPTLTYLQKSSEKKPAAFQMLKEQFPTFKVEQDVNYYEYEHFNSAIQTNICNKFSTRELLDRMSEQGLCKPFCESLLKK
ncbi:hypothetical protein [Bacillus sp. AK128]